MEWQPIETAPFGKIVEVKNDMMDGPVKATRGYTQNGVVHSNLEFFTSVATNYGDGSVFPFGRLVCPTKWREVDCTK